MIEELQNSNTMGITYLYKTKLSGESERVLIAIKGRRGLNHFTFTL